MLDETLNRLIIREIEEIDVLLGRASPLLDTPANAEPSFERLAALSTVLKSFYTGIERIFERIVRQVDSAHPEGESWHTELLNQVARPNEIRPAIISEQSRQFLRDYLAFRHRSRHAYAQYLIWSSMAQPVVDIPELWNTVRSEILRFIQSQSPPADTE
jgi:hypothetical protein